MQRARGTDAVDRWHHQDIRLHAELEAGLRGDDIGRALGVGDDEVEVLEVGEDVGFVGEGEGRFDVGVCEGAVGDVGCAGCLGMSTHISISGEKERGRCDLTWI